MYKVLDLFTTDNQIVNCIILALVSLIIQRVSRFDWNMIYWKWGIPKESIYVENFYLTYNDQLSNVINWYLNLDTEKYTCATVKYCNKNVAFSLYENIKCMFMFDSQKFYITHVVKYTNNDTSKKIGDYFLLEYYGKEKKVLTRFIKEISKKYEKYMLNEIWKPYIYFMENEGCSKIDWKAIDFENYTTFDTLILNESVRQNIRDDIQNFLASEEDYRKKGLTWSRGYLFHGKPGGGKTSMIKAISNEAKMNIYSIDLNMIESDQELRKLFRGIPKRSILVFEDVDCLSKITLEERDKKKKKEKDEKSDTKEEEGFTLSALLNELDGISNQHGRIKVMTTNFKEALDSALIRPGRIDYCLEVGFASQEQIVQCIKLYTDSETQNIQVSKNHIDKYTVAQVCNMVSKGFDFTK